MRNIQAERGTGEVPLVDLRYSVAGLVALG